MSFLLNCIVLISLFGAATAQQYCMARFRDNYRHGNETYPYATHLGIEEIECRSQCSADSQCVSIDYRKETYFCRKFNFSAKKYVVVPAGAPIRMYATVFIKHPTINGLCSELLEENLKNGKTVTLPNNQRYLFRWMDSSSLEIKQMYTFRGSESFPMEIKPEFIFIGILILVPAQWFLSPSETGHWKYHMNRLLATLKKYFPSTLMATGDSDKVLESSSAEIEEEMDLNENGIYGMGTYIRQRAPHVEFRVGDVVRLKKANFRAVIVGWDLEANAPEEYLKVTYGDNKSYEKQPNYAVIIDTRDSWIPKSSYIAQEHMEISKGTIWHPLLQKFFDRFDEKRQRYIMRPGHKQWYPDD